MRNKVVSVVVSATALTMAATLCTSVSASADVATTKKAHIISTHRTLAECEKAGKRYSGDGEYWDCLWDSPFWALWATI
ncbi:hypothetical protein [Nonomuraea sp. NPDC049158]|uniref:hypothetical protein n=1 Tax=Nonomuraea sp. NPDC049158 TaxID=3155649 RepID=UPI0033DC8545